MREQHSLRRLWQIAAMVLLAAIVATAFGLLFFTSHLSWKAPAIEAAVAVLVAAGGFVRWLLSAKKAGEASTADGPTIPSLPVVVPVGDLPQVVRGRDELTGQLHKLLRRPSGGPAVLTGPGGVGKSTVAISFAEACQRHRFARRRREVWWVSAVDQPSLTGGLVTVARALGAAQAELELIRSGSPDGPDVLWRRLDGSDRRWVLLLDNADEPEVLAAPRMLGTQSSVYGDRRPGTGDGWMRSSRRGMVIITTRVDDRSMWGRNSWLIPVRPLASEQAAQVLLDLAPEAGSAAEARQLAERLGGMPLPLRIAGLRLGSDTARRQTFGEFARAIDDPDRRPRILTDTVAFGLPSEPRYVVMRTWELSLDDLARLGVPQARPLLRVLSCFAAPLPIPRNILSSASLDVLTAGSGSHNQSAEDRLDDALRGLQARGLIEIRPVSEQQPGGQSIVVQSVIADTNRSHLANASDGERDAALIRQAAVEIIVDALQGLDPDDNDHWPAYLILGPHLRALYDTVARRLGSEQLELLVAATTIVARAYNFMGDISEGERLCRAARSVTDLLGTDNLAILRAGKELAWTLAVQEKWAEAHALYEQLGEAFERTLGHDNPNSITTRHELAWVAGCQERWPDAEARYNEVLDARSHVLGPEDKATLVTKHELAWAIGHQAGREDDAERILREVLDARRRVLSRHDRRILLTERELAWVAAKRGANPARAVAEYEGIMATFRSDFGARHPETLTTWQELAWALALAGDRNGALREYENVLTTRESTLGVSHPRTVATRRALDMLRQGVIITPLHIV